MRFIIFVIAFCLAAAAAAAAAAAEKNPTELISEASDDEQVDIVIGDDGNVEEEVITADSYGVIVKDGKVIQTINGKPIENEPPPKTQPKPSVNIDDVLDDLFPAPGSRPKPKPTEAVSTDAEEVQYDIDERFGSDAPDGISEVKGSDKVVLGVQISGALIKLNKQDRRANFELDQMISAMREKRSRDFIYRVEAILAPRNDRCRLVLLEQEDADYQKLSVTCGRRTYEVSDGISREQRFEEENRDRNNHRHHDRPAYNRPNHDHHRRP